MDDGATARPVKRTAVASAVVAAVLSPIPLADELILAGNHSDPVKSVRELTHGRGADIAIEAVGKPQTWEWSANMVRRGGIVNFFGGCPNDSKVNLDTALLHYSEITCKASFHHTPAYIRKALDLVSAGHITASFFVNREEPLAGRCRRRAG